jgi:choline dehydrogenase-like flavoprotein
MTEYQYIVVGGGSGGAAVAGRLSEDSDRTVLVLEEGPRDWHPWIHLPGMMYKTATGGLLQRLEFEHPQGGELRVAPTMVQARFLGRGSSVNGMVYMRGIPEDYDRWAAQGASGWSYADVLPYFVRAESNDTFANAVHGSDGPVEVSSPEYVDPLSKAWLQACQQFGMPFNPDFNAGTQAGCGFYQMTARRGRRSSASVAYLRPARRRANLEVRTRQRVLRVLIENGRAVGVEVANDGRVSTIRATREVIVCAGAINSPKLMLLSGIGPADHLNSMGIPVVHDLPGVGQNLQDHMDVYMIYELNRRMGYDRYKRWDQKLWAGLEYALFNRSPLSSNIIEAGAFWWGNRSDPRPDVQFAFLPGSGVEEGVDAISGGWGCTLNACQTRPRSHGFVELRSKDPATPPRIAPNYLSDPYDLDCMADAVKCGLEIMRQPAIAAHIKRAHYPKRAPTSRNDFRQYVRERAQRALHPSGTCKIGIDRMAVVDSELRVRGIDALRIADASVMPSVPSGNTNAPCIMVGERAADFIRNGSSADARTRHHFGALQSGSGPFHKQAVVNTPVRTP